MGKVSARELLTLRCDTGKICYVRYDDAQIAAESIAETRGIAPGCHVEAYRCSRCGLYHVGNRRIIFKD